MQQKTTKKADTQANAPKISARDSENNVKSILPPDFQLNLSDFALFLSVMKVKEAYQDVLSIILDEPDLNLKEVKVEQVILNKSGKRAIRLDAWAQDNKNRQFDMEMQKRFQTFHSQTVPVKFF